MISKSARLSRKFTFNPNLFTASTRGKKIGKREREGNGSYEGSINTNPKRFSSALGTGTPTKPFIIRINVRVINSLKKKREFPLLRPRLPLLLPSKRRSFLWMPDFNSTCTHVAGNPPIRWVSFFPSSYIVYYYGEDVLSPNLAVFGVNT